MPATVIPSDQPGDLRSASPSDWDLVQSCLQGNHQSFRLLYRQHQAKVRSTLYQLCGSHALDDLVQEVFLRVWKGLRGFRRSAKFSTWLYRITWNVATDQRRKLGKQRSQTAEREPLAEDVPQETLTPNLDQVHYQDLVQRGLALLSEEQRSVVVLHDLQDLRQTEIAQILAIPVGTVKSRLFHARSSLRQFFQQEGLQL